MPTEPQPLFIIILQTINPALTAHEVIQGHPGKGGHVHLGLARLGGAECGQEERRPSFESWKEGWWGDVRVRGRSLRPLCELRAGLSLKESRPRSVGGIEIPAWFLISRPRD